MRSAEVSSSCLPFLFSSRFARDAGLSQTSLLAREATSYVAGRRGYTTAGRRAHASVQPVFGIWDGFGVSLQNNSVTDTRQ